MMKIIALFMVFTISLFAGETLKDQNKIDLTGKELTINDEVLKYFTIEGYFRLLTDYRNNFDLNSFYVINPNTSDEEVVGASKHLPTIGELKNGMDSSSTVSYTTRLRLSPNVLIGEYLRAVATVDVFDNQLFGDYSKSYLFAKEAYFEAKSPIGMFTVGRIATGWGLGINRNSGKGKFSMYGNYIDQFQYELRDLVMTMPDLSFKLAYEIKDSDIGNNKFKNLNNTYNDTYDLQDNDDYVGFTFYIENKLDDSKLDEYLIQDKNIFNYGIYMGMYHKNKDSEINTDNSGATSNYSYENYSLDYYTFDGYLEYYKGKSFNIRAEFLYSFGTNGKGEDFAQWGGAVETDFKFLMNTLGVGIDAGIASKDESDDSDPYKTLGKTINYKKDNFVFNKDYDIDLIFFKQLYDVNGLYYIKPHLSWLATENISLTFQNVTSFSLSEKQTYGRDTYLGTEFDFFVEYLNKDGFNLGLRSGLFIPGSGMDWLGVNGERGENSSADYKDYEADIAYSFQLFMIMKF